jgi:hypothetical protein
VTIIAIDQVAQERLHELRDLAASRPIDMRNIVHRLSTAGGKIKHMQRMTEQTIEIPGPWPFLVTFSIEINHPCGTARHLSMSVRRENRVPSPDAIWIIAKELGFVGEHPMMGCQIWLEDLQGHGKAVNVVQPIALVSDQPSDRKPH